MSFYQHKTNIVVKPTLLTTHVTLTPGAITISRCQDAIFFSEPESITN